MIWFGIVAILVLLCLAFAIFDGEPEAALGAVVVLILGGYFSTLMNIPFIHSESTVHHNYTSIQQFPDGKYIHYNLHDKQYIVNENGQYVYFGGSLNAQSSKNPQLENIYSTKNSRWLSVFHDTDHKYVVFVPDSTIGVVQ